MKFAIALIVLTFAYTFASRDWDRGTGDDDDDDIGRGGIRRGGGGRNCLLIRGYVRCGDEHEVHDGKTVVLRMVDGIRGILDEGYSSKHGYFELFGCTVSGSLRPELHVLHVCKGNQPRRLKVTIPESARGEHNITDVVDLKAFYQHEESYAQPIDFPCDPL